MDDTIKSGMGVVTPTPPNGILVGLACSVALCVMMRVSKDAPATAGEKLTVTICDCPGGKMKGPPPLTIEKGPVRAPTLPVNGPVEMAWLSMVMFWLADCPTVTLPKFKEAGLTEIWMPGVTPVPIKGTLVGLV